MSTYLKALAGIGIASMTLAGCNVSSGSGSDSGSGTFSLDVTDAPIDSAAKVNVVFNGVDIQAASGTLVEIRYDEAKTIDLLSLQGGKTDSLLAGETLAAGDYEWIRLKVQATKEAGGSNIVLDDGSENDLFIPSGDQTGLKMVQGFTVPENGSASFTIDFDLRKSVVVTGPPSDPSYILKPTLRLVDNTKVGEISGTVSDTTVSAATVGGETGDCSVGAAVYVYEGADVTPGDVGSEVEPISSVQVDTTQEGETEYGYTAAFLTEGEYTVSFTCDADNDDPQASGDAMAFFDTQNATVTAEASFTIDFN